MIKFILLLPLKIIGLLFMAIGTILERREKERIAAAREYERRIAAAQKEQDRRERSARIATERAQADRRRAEKEKQAQAVKAQKAADRRKAEKFKSDQARTDIEHYRIQRSELLKLYNEIERQYSDAATDSKKEIAFRKMIALNNQIRGVDRQIEKAQYTINKSGPE